MRNFSISRLADIVTKQRKELHLTQQQLAEMAGMNRSMLCHLERQDYVPSLDHLSRLTNALQIDVTDVFIEYNTPVFYQVIPRKIAVYGTGSNGLSTAVLLARQHQVVIVDPNPEESEQINRRSGPFENEYIEKYMMNESLELTATTDERAAYRNADFTVIAVPTGYTSGTGSFDTAELENVMEKVLVSNPDTVMIIRSRVPVGFSNAMCKKLQYGRILTVPDLSQEGKELYDNLYPARIVVGSEKGICEKAQEFAGVLKSSALNKDTEILLTGSDEAEAIALLSDTVLSVRRFCMNEIDSFAEARGLNAREIIRGVCLDPRIGNQDCNPSFTEENRNLPENTEQIIRDSAWLPGRMLTAVAESRRIRLDKTVDSVLRMAGVTQEEYGRIMSGEKKITVGIYRLTGKNGDGPIRNKDYQEIMMRLRARGVEYVIYEPKLENASVFCSGKVVNHLRRFKKQSDVIMADCYNTVLDDVKDKVYTRDLGL